jgi:signal transduction histidine kinase
MSAEKPASDADGWMFAGTGEMSALIRDFNWSATPLGPVDQWPHSLKTTVAMLLHSRHPMFLWWGPELIQIYNDAYLPSFGIGKHPAALGQRGDECWPEIWHIIGSQIDDVMQRGVPSWHEDALVPIFRNGAIEDVYWTYGYSPVFKDDGSIGGTLVVCTETTARVSAARHEAMLREAAELANRAKDDFLATASHELRTPLNAILGWARMLQSGALQQEDFVRAVDSIERNGRAQVRLIDDILDGSRIITGKLQLEVGPLDLTTVVRAALDSVQAAADAKRITLTASLDANAALIVGDSERLQQVVWNLANNAIKFTPKEGTVSVTLRLVGSDVELTVTDSGIGIASDFLPHVFERFRQGEESSKRTYGGLGLGLALVRHLVEAHGGSVSASSAGPGQGSTFAITLPVQATFPAMRLVPPIVRVSAAVTQRTIDLKGVAILVVDDEEDARDLIATLLRSKGADVRTSHSAEAALKLIASMPFAAMVSDVAMPMLDGYDLMQRIRGLGLSLPAVALTAYSRDEDRRRALDAGFQDYISKPVEPEALVSIVSGLLRAR